MNAFTKDAITAAARFRNNREHEFHDLLRACDGDDAKLAAAHQLLGDMTDALAQERDRLGRVIAECERRGELRGMGTPAGNA